MNDLKISAHSLYWNNTKEIYKYHQKVMYHLKVPVNYYNVDGLNHGEFLNQILRKSKDDILIFFDIDCIITNKNILEVVVDWVCKNNSFVGLAQCSNHIQPRTHIFAAPSFLVISKDCYNRMDQPSCIANYRSDVAEELSHVADAMNITYRCIYPNFYEKEPVEGKWKLGNYGYFGVGCHYNENIYNLYQSRMGNNDEMFKSMCMSVINGTDGKERNQKLISCVEV